MNLSDEGSCEEHTHDVLPGGSRITRMIRDMVAGLDLQLYVDRSWTASF